MSNQNKQKSKIARFFSDFKTFISKGNILDMAIGVVIGGAFGKIVTSLVNDIIMPLISLAVGGKSIDDWKWVITQGTDEIAESAIHYGLFLQSIIDFLIIAFFIFLALRIIVNFKTKLQKEESGEVVFSKEERRTFIKQYRKEGNSRRQAIAMLDQKEAEMTAAKEAERIAVEEAERQVIESEKEKQETTQSILKDIRDLLNKQ